MDIDSTEMTTFVDRYAGVWNEPDAAVRRARVTELWAEDGVEWTESAEHRGHAELEARITAAYEQFVRDGGFVFVPGGDALGHHGALTLTTHMVPATGGRPVWTGRTSIVLDDDARIRTEHQFVVSAGVADATRAAAEEFLRRLGDGDPERIAELFAPTVDWQLDWPADGHPAVPWIRARSTRADVADHFRALAEFHVPEKRGGGAPTVLVDGPDAVVLGEIRQAVRATGTEYTARCALRLTVEDGLITHYHVYEDSLSVARALGGRRGAAEIGVRRG